MPTTWTVAKLRTVRDYPQANEVVLEFLNLAIADVERINPTLYASDAATDIQRVDRAIEQLVRIDTEPTDYSGNYDGGVLVNSVNDARNRILSQLVGAGRTLPDGRVREVVRPNVLW